MLTDQDGDKEGDQNKVTLMNHPCIERTGIQQCLYHRSGRRTFPGPAMCDHSCRPGRRTAAFLCRSHPGRKTAFMSFATSRYKNGQVVSSRPSRFIGEIDQEFLEGYIAMREEPSGFKLKTTTAMSGLHKRRSL